MPLMGYAAWREFANPINRAHQTAQNTGMACLFMGYHRKDTGGRPRADVYLDRMAAYLVAMNGDPNKPEAELTTYPRLLPPHCARANL